MHYKYTNKGHSRYTGINNNNQALRSIYNSYFISLGIDTIFLISRYSPFELFDDLYKNKSLIIKVNGCDAETHSICIAKGIVVNVRRFHTTYNIIPIDYFTYEFGGLYQYKQMNDIFKEVLSRVYDASLSISRIDFALDIRNIQWNKFKSFSSYIHSTKTYNNGIYYNMKYSKKRRSTLYIYNKSDYKTNTKTNNNLQHSLLSYSNITRIELRLKNAFLTSRKLKKILHPQDVKEEQYKTLLHKAQKNIIDELNRYEIVYDDDKVDDEYNKDTFDIYDNKDNLFDVNNTLDRKNLIHSNDISNRYNVISDVYNNLTKDTNNLVDEYMVDEDNTFDIKSIVNMQDIKNSPHNIFISDVDDSIAFIYDNVNINTSYTNNISNKNTLYTNNLPIKQNNTHIYNNTLNRDTMSHNTTSSPLIFDSNTLKIKEVIQEFILFLQSQSRIYISSSYKKFYYELTQQKRILERMMNVLKVNSVFNLVQTIQDNKLSINHISNLTSIHRNTIKQIYEHFNICIDKYKRGIYDKY